MIFKISINEPEIDDEIYPRVQKSGTTSDDYAQKILAGEKFPPIVVQRIKHNEEIKIALLDGYHTIEGTKKYNKIIKDNNSITDDEKEKLYITELNAKHWKDDVLDREENLIELMIVSAELNIRHGLKLKSGDVKSQLEKIARINPDPPMTWESIGKSFGVTRDWTYTCIAPIRARYYASRYATEYKLNKFLGWTQEEVANLFGITQGTVSANIDNIKSSISSIISDFYEDHKTSETITEYYDIDFPLFWAIVLEGKDDLERFELFTEKRPEEFNIWNFHSLDPRLGHTHPMNIPGQIAMNVLYYFTEQGDLVIDPMAGGGSTVDACLVMGRKCRAYDLVPIKERMDIVKRDMMDGFDENAKNCDLIFLDPPYGDMVFFKDNKKFYDFLELCATQSYETVKQDGIVALVMCDRTKGGYDPFISESYIIFKDVGFNCIQRISAPLTTQSAGGDEVNKAIENKKMLGRDRVVYIFRK